MIEHGCNGGQLVDAAIKACALMIKGICMTKPQDEWTALIEKRIQFMLKSAERADADTAGAQPCEYCDVNYPYHDLDCPVSIAALAKSAYEAEYGASTERADAKPCTCHPDDNPPKPCAKKYALNECRERADADTAGAISDEHAHTLYKLAHQTGFFGWLNEFRKSLAAGASNERADAAPNPSDKPYVETQPGSPNFDGAEAWEAHLDALFGPERADADPDAVLRAYRQGVEDATAFPYQKTFDAIAAATSISCGTIAISVIKFREVFGLLDKSAERANAEKDAALTKLLPGAYYMDPPDGGSVTLLEQLERMSQDAKRYRCLRNCYSERERTDVVNQWDGAMDESLDAAIEKDAAILAANGEKK